MEEQQNRDLIDHRGDNTATTRNAVPTVILTSHRIDNIRNEHYEKSGQVAKVLKAFNSTKFLTYLNQKQAFEKPFLIPHMIIVTYFFSIDSK
jgi:hypothetical protein